MRCVCYCFLLAKDWCCKVLYCLLMWITGGVTIDDGFYCCCFCIDCVFWNVVV